MTIRYELASRLNQEPLLSAHDAIARVVAGAFGTACERRYLEVLGSSTLEIKELAGPAP